MKKCSNCNETNPDDALYCHMCGKELVQSYIYETIELAKKRYNGLRLSLYRHKNKIWVEDFAKISKQIEDSINVLSNNKQNDVNAITNIVNNYQNDLIQLQNIIQQAKDKKSNDITQILRYNNLSPSDCQDIIDRFLSLSEFKVEVNRRLKEIKTRKQNEIIRKQKEKEEKERQERERQNRERQERERREKAERKKIIKTILIIAAIIGGISLIVGFWDEILGFFKFVICAIVVIGIIAKAAD